MEALFAYALGTIIGTSLSPEIWLAVAVVVFFSRDNRGLVISFVLASMALGAVRALFGIGVEGIIFGVVALAIWSAVGIGIRRLFSRPSSLERVRST